MFDARQALAKVMRRTARRLTPGLRNSCSNQGWPDDAVRKMSVRLQDADHLWYADYKGKDAKPALDLEYGDGSEPPRPGIHNYFESRSEQKRAGRLLVLDATEFVDEIERLLRTI